MAQRVRVFISHSARDGDARAAREAIRAELQSAQQRERYALLMDDLTLSPGDAWRARINLWIGACDAAVVIVSPEALESAYVAYEVSILGYRWATQPQFRIIPVLTGVTMAQLLASKRLAPALTAESTAVAGGTPGEIAAKVVKALDGVLPAASRPIERMARVLDAHLPGGEFFLDQAAAALGIELPWDVNETKRFCLALQLLGSGMTVPCVKAVRQLKSDPSFQSLHLPAIIDLLTSAWVDLHADELPSRLQSDPPPALVLNAALTDTVKMYMHAARYRAEPVLTVHVAEPNTVIEERKTEPQYLAEIIRSVRQELMNRLEASTAEELKRTLHDYCLLGEPVVVAIPSRTVSPEIVAELQSEFEHVTFFLLAGTKADLDSIDAPAIHVIQPPLAETDEDRCREQYGEFCRLIHRK